MVQLVAALLSLAALLASLVGLRRKAKRAADQHKRPSFYQQQQEQYRTITDDRDRALEQLSEFENENRILRNQMRAYELTVSEKDAELAHTNAALADIWEERDRLEREVSRYREPEAADCVWIDWPE